MKVLLTGTIPIDIFYPMGLLCLYSYVKARMPDIEIKIIECWDINTSPKELEAFAPDIFGISSMSQSYELACRAARTARELKPDLPIVLGGTHVSLLPEAFRRCFDIGVIGEGEDTLCELLKCFLSGKPTLEQLEKIDGLIFWREDKTYRTKVRMPVNLEQYPLMDYSPINKKMFKIKPIGTWGVWGVEGLIETSRGCPFRCIFCATSRFWGKPRFFPIEWVVQNILNLIVNYGCTHIQMTDDLFASSKKHLREMAEAFSKYKIQEKIELACSSRASIFDAEFCELIKAVGGTTVFFGFESGNERVLQLLKGESAKLAANYNAVKICYEGKLECWGSFVLGAPTETIDEMYDTLRFIQWSKKYKTRRMGIGILAPYPGSPIWELALKMGRVSLDMDFSQFILRRDIAVDGAFIEPERRLDFAKLWDDAQRVCHSFKWLKAWCLFKSNPLRTLLYLFQAPWPIIKRLFVPTMP